MEVDFNQTMQRLKAELPGTMEPFNVMHTAVLSEGVLSVKAKRLILLGASVAIRCEPCIRVRTQGALEAVATREEILQKRPMLASSWEEGRPPPTPPSISWASGTGPRIETGSPGLAHRPMRSEGTRARGIWSRGPINLCDIHRPVNVPPCHGRQHGPGMLTSSSFIPYGVVVAVMGANR